jgi:hypothetical protein|tara:strand:- start:617 stop:1501 length:885 start_codon:yes stop_codon:yes gene_type:complete
MSKEMNMAEAQAVEEENIEVMLDDDQKKVEVQEEALQVETEKADGEELDNYSKGVQKRIKKLTEKYRYAERDKEEASRVAEVLKNENEQLKTKLSNLDQGYLSEYGTRLDSQLGTARQSYKDAHDRGDVDAMIDAQQALSKISIEQERFRLAKQRQEQHAVQPVQQQPVEVQQTQPATKPDPKAERWAEKNTWFGDDEIMTQAAFVIDNNLRAEGFDGTEDEYYTQLDTRLRERFPNDMGVKQNEGSSRVASASTSASRSNKQGRRTVKLSPSQVAMAKKLGVPLEEYAKYVKD